MEFSLREWLILIGVVIIVVILIDGFRRYKKGQEFAQSDDGYDDLEGFDEDVSFNQPSQLYQKGKHSERTDASQNPIVNAFENARKTANAPLTEVPHKVDSGPELDRDDELHLDELASLVPEKEFDGTAMAEQDYLDDGFYEQDELDLDSPDDDGSVSFHDEEDYERSYSEVDIAQVTPQGTIDDLEEDDLDEDVASAEIEEVIVINIFAPEGESFAGMELLQLILNCGMRYGDMDIFHRHEDGFDRGRVQFSMANAIEPGTFDLETMGEGESPGVSFFMGLPGPKNSMKAFDFMLETAQTLVRNLGGELYDERRTPMSEQTIAHCRQRIRDFERRRLMRNKQ